MTRSSASTRNARGALFPDPAPQSIQATQATPPPATKSLEQEMKGRLAAKYPAMFSYLLKDQKSGNSEGQIYDLLQSFGAVQ